MNDLQFGEGGIPRGVLTRGSLKLPAHPISLHSEHSVVMQLTDLSLTDWIEFQTITLHFIT
jgi:hypothetical protein